MKVKQEWSETQANSVYRLTGQKWSTPYLALNGSDADSNGLLCEPVTVYTWRSVIENCSSVGQSLHLYTVSSDHQVSWSLTSLKRCAIGRMETPIMECCWWPPMRMILEETLGSTAMLRGSKVVMLMCLCCVISTLLELNKLYLTDKYERPYLACILVTIDAVASYS